MTAQLEDLEAPVPLAAHGQGRLVDTIGTPVVVTVEDAYGTMVPIDPCLIVGAVTIRYGRDSVSTPVAEPASATVQLITPPGDAGSVFPLRRRLAVDLAPGAQTHWGVSPTALEVHRYAGRITEVALASDPQLGSVLTITAGGPTADLGRVVVGDVPWPQELARARVLRVMTLAGFGTTGGTGLPAPPNSPAVLPRDVDRQSALDLIATYAALGLCYVVDDRVARDQVSVFDLLATAAKVAAALELADPLTAAVVVLDACELLADWSALWSMAGMLNRLSIGYGVIPDGGQQPRSVFDDLESQDRFGVMADSLTTDLVGHADAQALADARFASLAEPTPALPELRCDLWRTVPQSLGRPLFRMRINDLVGLTDIPQAVPVNRAGLVVLNGYSETITPDSWAMTLSVVDPIPGGNTQLWYLIPDGDTWANTPPAVLWVNSGDYDW